MSNARNSDLQLDPTSIDDMLETLFGCSFLVARILDRVMRAQ